nr:RICIN domain-containing protein [Ruminococcus sp.]
MNKSYVFIPKATKLIAVLLSLFMTFAFWSYVPQMKAEAYSSAYPIPSLTGNQREDIVNVALSQKGYKKNGGTVYGAWYDSIKGTKFVNSAWCAMFVSWCANQAGIGQDILTYRSYVPDMISDFKSRGQWHDRNYTPSRGDIIIVNSSGHVGIVTGVSGNTVYTIEGNKSSLGSACGTDSYKIGSSYITGYGVPNYSNSSVSKPSWAWISATDDRTSFSVGEEIHFWFSADETHEAISQYLIGINKNGERIITEECGRDYYISFNEPGEYSVYVSAYNSAGWADSNTIIFQIINPIPQGHVMSENEAAGQTIPDGDYWIYSSINQNYALDIPGDGISSPGANIQTWIWDTEVMPTQYDVFTVTYCKNGFYEIRQKGTDLCLDVFDASLNRGTNVQLWTKNDTASQQWSITRTDNGYMLQARCNGYCLDVYGGKLEKENNIQVWEQNNTLSQRFLFIPYGKSYGRSIDDGVYSIRSTIDSNYCIDASGNAVNLNYKNETNIQLWETASCDDLFYVEYLSDGYYNISEISTGLSLDIYNPNYTTTEYMKVKTNIQLYKKHNGRSQSWLIKDTGDGTYAIISKLSGYCVDLSGGLCEKSQNIAQFIYNYTGAQKWQFVPVAPEKISVNSKPNKINYNIGDAINLTGISVREIYSVDTFTDITDKVIYS